MTNGNNKQDKHIIALVEDGYIAATIKGILLQEIYFYVHNFIRSAWVIKSIDLNTYITIT